MSLERPTRSDGEDTPEVLAELTGRPAEDFEYDGEIPSAAEQEWEFVDDE